MDLDARRLSPHKQVRHIIVSHLAAAVWDVTAQARDPLERVVELAWGFEKPALILSTHKGLGEIREGWAVSEGETSRGGRSAHDVETNSDNVLDLPDGWSKDDIKTTVAPRSHSSDKIGTNEPLLQKQREDVRLEDLLQSIPVDHGAEEPLDVPSFDVAP